MAGDTLPKYIQIKNEIKNWVISGKLQPGDRIPTEIELAQQFNISRHTVRQAMTELVHERLLYREQGRGTFLADASAKKATKQEPSHIIGVITTYISDYIFPSIIRGIEETASREGYSIILASTQNQTEMELKALQSAMHKHVDGLIVEPTLSCLPNPNLGYYLSVLNDRTPIVMLHTSYPELNVPCVRIDDKKAGQELTEYLVSLGHRNIGGIFKSDDLQGKFRLTGLVHTLRSSALEIPGEFISVYGTDEKSKRIEEYADRFAKSKAEFRPTAIVCYNDQVAIELISQLEQRRVSVPDDVSIVSFDNSQLAETGTVKLTSIDHPKYEMGRVAGELIINEIRRSRSKPWERPKDIVLPSELVVRSSSQNLNTMHEQTT